MAENGGPAFMYSGIPAVSSGVTVRDYYTAAAMAGIIPLVVDKSIEPKKAARITGELVDAMMAERQ